MKKIEAIIRPDRLDDVKRALYVAGYHGVTAVEVSGHGRQRGIRQTWRGGSFEVDLLPKILLMVVVPDGKAKRVVSAIAGAAKSGKIGDGKIFISAVQDAVRVRTGERGQKAL